MKNGLEDYYVIKNNKKLRYGYTTGSCAAAAAKAAARMLLTGETVENVDLMTPKGILLHLEILDIHKGEEEVSCAVRKDGGDDPDATHGLLVYAAVRKKKESGVTIDGGRGVGRVTKRGLEQPRSLYVKAAPVPDKQSKMAKSILNTLKQKQPSASWSGSLK